MTRTCFTFPPRIENGSLALSSDFDRDEQDIISVIQTRMPERVMRPYTAGTPDFTFSTVNVPSLIAQKLAIAIEEQCPTIARCQGIGSVNDSGMVVAELYWTPKAEPKPQTLRIGIGNPAPIPVPTIAIATSTPKAALVGVPLIITASTSGTIARVLFRIDGISIGPADTSPPYQLAYTPSTIGVKQVVASAVGGFGAAAVSQAYNIEIFNTQISSGGSGAGTSLVANAGDRVLFNGNLSAGGFPDAVDLFVGNAQVGVLNFLDDAYNGRRFVFFRSSNSTFYAANFVSGQVLLNAL
ncbi:MAG TPA: Ig-like domain-containing protein [Allocoleopsis sp.]